MPCLEQSVLRESVSANAANWLDRIQEQYQSYMTSQEGLKHQNVRIGLYNFQAKYSSCLSGE